MPKRKIPKRKYTYFPFSDYLKDDIIDWHDKGASPDQIVNEYLTKADYDSEKEWGMNKNMVRAFIQTLPKSKAGIKRLEKARGRKTHPTTGETVWL